MHTGKCINDFQCRFLYTQSEMHTDISKHVRHLTEEFMAVLQTLGKQLVDSILNRIFVSHVVDFNGFPHDGRTHGNISPKPFRVQEFLCKAQGKADAMERWKVHGSRKRGGSVPVIRGCSR